MSQKSRRLAALALIGAPLLIAQPAAAQTDTVDPETEPANPGEDTGFGGLDFGDSVVIQEDGSVIWNEAAETEEADLPATAGANDPTATDGAEVEGIEGTGTLGTPAPGADNTTDPQAPAADGETPATERDPLDASDAAGAGNNIALMAAMGAAGIFVLAAGLFYLRSRGRNQDDLVIIEDVLDGLDEMESPGDQAAPHDGVWVAEQEPAYAGAEDAGAYNPGGAAYAQYSAAADPTIDTEAMAASAAQAATQSRFDQLRTQVVDFADKGIADAGHARLMAAKLEAAGSSMRPGEFLVLAVAGTLAALAGATFLLGILLGVFAGILVAGAFYMSLDFKTGKRQRAFADDLPETLGLIAGSLRGGLSMMQAIQTVADEADEPTSGEFQRLVTESRLGRDLALSFRDLSQRMDSKDFEWVVTAIEIHREVGGDLASILDRVGKTIRERNRVRGQVKALSAEGRVSGLILFLLPIVMTGLISMMNPEYLNEMLNETEGQIMMIGAGCLLIVGGVWLKRLARFVY